MWKIYLWSVKKCITQGLPYEFGCYEHPALASRFILQKRTLLIDINVRKLNYSEYRLYSVKIYESN